MSDLNGPLYQGRLILFTGLEADVAILADEDTGHDRKFLRICINLSKFILKIVSSRISHLIRWKAIT